MAAEKVFETKIKTWLKSEGIYPLGTSKSQMQVEPCGYYEKRWGGGTFTKAGLPDLHIVVCGRSIDVEVKAPNGKPSELQLFTINQINECGGKAILLYPKDFAILKKLIKEEKEKWLPCMRLTRRF